MEAQLERIRNGWAAVGKGWAVFGETPEEAKESFRLAEAKHAEIESRRKPPEEPREP